MYREAICALSNGEDRNVVSGVVEFTQRNPNSSVTVNVYIKNISPGKHGFHIHASGNISEGAKTLCSHYNPHNKKHGGRNDPEAHLGDLGNVIADKNGEVYESFEAKYLRLDGPYSILGRSVVVHQDEDDLGLGTEKDSKTSGHSGQRILWGIIGLKLEC